MPSALSSMNVMEVMMVGVVACSSCSLRRMLSRSLLELPSSFFLTISFHDFSSNVFIAIPNTTMSSNFRVDVSGSPTSMVHSVGDEMPVLDSTVLSRQPWRKSSVSVKDRGEHEQIDCCRLRGFHDDGADVEHDAMSRHEMSRNATESALFITHNI